MNKTISFLLGAGCEGEGQLGLPVGQDFKRDTILASGVSNLIYKINKREKPVIKNGTIIQHNSYSILYQTLCEIGIDSFDFSTAEKTIAEQYMSLSNGTIKYTDAEKTEIRKKFAQLYKEVFYEAIKQEVDNERLNIFLKTACFYSFVDSLFNYLRKPNQYRKEVNRVAKLYFAAYKSIIGSLEKGENSPTIEVKLLAGNISEARAQLSDYVEQAQLALVFKNSNNKSLYYHMIRDFKHNHTNCTINVITTNYTVFAQKMIGLKDEEIAYVHGKLELFEDVKTKRIDKITNFSEEDFVFPFILVQSGIKPIVNAFQIQELEKTRKIIMESDELLILGYGINSDDEHITNLLRERLRMGKSIICFMYKDSPDAREEIHKLLFSKSGIIFKSCSELEGVLSGLAEDKN